jgi:hypothetical protein|tara:strand:+ start:299 stop:472 length:174 start_codon:yes stop_codon:yes gene_type:complete
MMPRWVVLFEDGSVTYIRAPSKEHIRQRVGGVRSIFMMNRKFNDPETNKIDEGEPDE